MKRINEYPCHNCTDRFPACQSTCEKYIEENKRQKEEKERLKAYLEKDKILDDYEFQRRYEKLKRR